MEIQTFRNFNEVTATVKFTQEEVDFADQEWGGIEDAVRSQFELMENDFAIDGGIDQ